MFFFVSSILISLYFSNNAKFLSFKSGICGKKTFDFEKYEDSNGFSNYIIYISYIFDENHKIQSGLLFLENLLLSYCIQIDQCL